MTTTPWYEVRDSTVGQGYKAIYVNDPGEDPVQPERLVAVLAPGHLELLRKALEKAKG